ncbi:Protein of unknown function [Pyronema omphalodes CBS 100304]|uniref:F-box domain-containing protein n=1 Tax=Pyronema omphalodes (strain CBS 100304) TaxID=1076935 RepID=U4L504_PYROM|nr:Protein of unknown function [Pyronema omphalodes CBS 100304]
MSLSDLPYELVFLIFTQLPDLLSTQYLAASSRTLDAVYKSQKWFIWRAVLNNACREAELSPQKSAISPIKLPLGIFRKRQFGDLTALMPRLQRPRSRPRARLPAQALPCAT